jgi:hypothetical protein
MERNCCKDNAWWKKIQVATNLTFILSSPVISAVLIMCYGLQGKKNLRAFGPLANYADRATAASWRSSTNFCG